MMWLMIVGCQLAQWVGVDGSMAASVLGCSRKDPYPHMEEIGNTQHPIQI